MYGLSNLDSDWRALLVTCSRGGGVFNIAENVALLQTPFLLFPLKNLASRAGRRRRVRSCETKLYTVGRYWFKFFTCPQPILPSCSSDLGILICTTEQSYAYKYFKTAFPSFPCLLPTLTLDTNTMAPPSFPCPSLIVAIIRFWAPLCPF